MPLTLGCALDCRVTSAAFLFLGFGRSLSCLSPQDLAGLDITGCSAVLLFDHAATDMQARRQSKQDSHKRYALTNERQLCGEAPPWAHTFFVGGSMNGWVGG